MKGHEIIKSKITNTSDDSIQYVVQCKNILEEIKRARHSENAGML